MKCAVFVFAVVACACAFDRQVLEPRHIWVPLPETSRSSPSESRVINGHDAPPGAHPYQAALLINGAGFCGGSLIRTDLVLTAAHCIDDAQNVQVVLGYHDVYEGLNSHNVILTWDVDVHPEWNRGALQNDIGVVRIPPVRLSNTIQTIRLAEANARNYAGEIATLSGWGRTSDDSNSIAPYLQTIQLEVLTNLRCRLNFLGQIINDQHICTSGNNGQINVGACNGDSGGPLVVNGEQVGVVSFGGGRCAAGFPTAFARVSWFRSYIDRH